MSRSESVIRIVEGFTVIVLLPRSSPQAVVAWPPTPTTGAPFVCCAFVGQLKAIPVNWHRRSSLPMICGALASTQGSAFHICTLFTKIGEPFVPRTLTTV